MRMENGENVGGMTWRRDEMRCLRANQRPLVSYMPASEYLFRKTPNDSIA